MFLTALALAAAMTQPAPQDTAKKAVFELTMSVVRTVEALGVPGGWIACIYGERREGEKADTVTIMAMSPPDTELVDNKVGVRCPEDAMGVMVPMQVNEPCEFSEANENAFQRSGFDLLVMICPDTIKALKRAPAASRKIT